MLRVFICEDDGSQRLQLEEFVNDFILIEHYNMELAFSTADPIALLENVKLRPDKNNLYFLDVDLGQEMDGIALASKIREIDTFGKIVFITTHAELSYLTFRYRVEALDYIIKGNSAEVARRMKECIVLAHKHYIDDDHPKRNGYPVKIGDQIQVIPYDDIICFESHPRPHIIVLHMENRQIEFRGVLKSLAKITPDFYRCNKTVIVNVRKIRRIDKTTNEIEMVSGLIVHFTPRKYKELLELILVCDGSIL